MKLKIICSVALIALIEHYSYSQTTYKSEGSTNYQVLIDNPDNLKPVIIGLNPLVADVWNTNSYMGIGAFVNVNILKYGSIYIDWKKAYLDGIKNSLNTVNANGKKIKNHRGIELGFAYNLLSLKKEKELQVVLGSSLTFSQTRRTQYTSYIMVPGTTKRILQLRGGYSNLKSGIDSYDFGTTSTFIFNNDTAIKVKSMLAQINMSYVYGGISWHTINNLVLQHSGSSLATNCNDYNFYVDVLYMPSDLKFPIVNYSDVYGKNTLPGGAPIDSKMTVLDDSKVKKTGWRLGWEARKNNIRGAFTYRVEFGTRPGLTNAKKGLLNANSYMLLTAGFTFPTGGKRYINKAKKD